MKTHFKAWLAGTLRFFAFCLCFAMCFAVHSAPVTVVSWGDNSHGQTKIPEGLTNIVKIAQGALHGLAINVDSTVTAWGYNYVYTTPPGLTNVVNIDAGYYSSLALKNDGSVVFWGDVNQTNLPSGLTNIIAIATRGNHSLALRDDKSLFCWGDNFLGASTIPPGLNDATAIGLGVYNGMAIRSNGTMTVWGYNGFGQTILPKSATNIIAATGGSYHILALRGDGTAVAWGDNSYGQGIVPANLSNVVAIAAGDYFNLALKKDGRLVAWGRNDLGQINIPSWVSNVVAISCSGSISMALMNDGSPWILGHPQNQTTYSGMSATFNVLAIGITNLNYQWQFNGGNINGATNVSLNLTNLQVTDSGNYSVLISNLIGSTISATGVLSVVTSAPILVALPTNQVVALRSNTLITVSATGSLPLSYQWQFQGTNILMATNLVLSITNAQWTNEGNYTVVITNAYGSITSSPSFLNVGDLGEALNATNLTWATSATGYWFPQASNNHDSVMAAQSGSLTSSQWSTLQTTVTGPGTMTFFWKVYRFDDIMFLTATNETIKQYRVITSTNWQKEVVYLGAGSQALQWWFKRAPTGTSQDAGWLDEVSYTDGATAATISASPTDQSLRVGTNATFAVSAYGTPPLSYQWLFNSNALNEATNAFLTVSNIQLINAGKYSVVVTNLYGSACSSIANLAVLIPNFNSSNSASIFTTNGFQLQLDGLTGHGSIIFYSSTNLIDWLPIFTNPPVTGSLQFIDSNALNAPFLFYRAAEQ